MLRLETILQQVVTRAAAWAWMRHEYLPAGPVCPGCGAPITGGRALAAWEDLRSVYCCGCGRRSAATLSTPIYQTEWQPEEYLQLLALRTAGWRRPEIAAALGKSSGAVGDMLDRIRLTAHSDPNPCPAPLTAQG